MVPSLTATPPTRGALPAGDDELAEWAAVALPLDRPGGAGWADHGAATVDAAGAVLPSLAHEGRIQLLVACESADGSPLSLRVAGGDAGPVEVPCAEPGGAPAGSASLVFDGGPDARVDIDATTDAVYAYALRPYVDPGS